MATVGQVKLDLAPLGRFGKAIRPGSPTMQRLLKRAALRYLTAAYRRYTTLSRGGAVNGDTWAPLAESTKRQRRGPRKGFKGVRKFATLIDTGTLHNALLQGSPGNLILAVGNGIEVGIGGGAREKDSDLTIGRLAEIHHEGNPDRGLPARKVIPDEVDEQTKRGMENDMAREFKTILGGK